MPPGISVLALHAGALDPSSWSDVEALAPELEFVTPHLGRLAEEAQGRFQGFVERLAARVPEGPVVVAGCSIGARIALAVAAHLGPRTHGLLLISGGPVEEDEAYLQFIRGLRSFMVDAFDASQIPSLTPVMMYRFGPRFSESAARVSAMLEREGGQKTAALGQFFEALPERPVDLLGRFEAPIEVMFGRYDPLLHSHWPEEWNRVKRARVSVLQNAAHQITLEAPEEVVEALRRLVVRPG
jgi:pimeloyl-ACP methyl ester carboxylesterase